VNSYIQVIIAALGLLHPEMKRPQRVAYATIVKREAKRAGVSGLEMVALVDHESRWHASVVGGLDGQCIGLGQICLHPFEACKEGFDSPGCNAKRSQLLNPGENLRIVGDYILKWRELCRKRTGHDELLVWYSGYGGFDSPARGIVCGQKKAGRAWQLTRLPKAVQDVADKVRFLRRSLRRI
jgi:hypothetical protein